MLENFLQSSKLNQVDVSKILFNSSTYGTYYKKIMRFTYHKNINAKMYYPGPRYTSHTSTSSTCTNFNRF